MSEPRYTASTITDDQLDALYAAIDRVRAVAALIEAGAPWTANHDETAARIRAALDGTAQTEESTTP